MRKQLISMLMLTLIGNCWLVTASGAAIQGRLDHEKKYAGAFKATLEVKGLTKDRTYVLSINGYKNHESNNVLKDKCEVNDENGEGFCDFTEASTDKDGNLKIEIEEKLPVGKYRIKFLVKDPDNWVVVWSKDRVKFEVTEKPEPIATPKTN